MTWGQLHRRGDLWAACKAKNKKFPGGLRRRGNSRPSKKHVPRENRAVLQARVAPVWPKLKTVTKLQGISWWGILFGITSYWDGFSPFWYFFPTSTLDRWKLSKKRVWSQTLKERKWKIPRSVGSSDEALLQGGPDPSVMTGHLPEQLEFKAVPTMATPYWNSMLDFPVCGYL